MIYKFEDCGGDPICLEVAVNSDDYQFDVIDFTTIIFSPEKHLVSLQLTKKDIYHLIGALHLLHKEMK